MDFDLDWTQEELRRSARKLLGERVSLNDLVAWEDGPDGFSRELYREMGELGWLALGHTGAPGEVSDPIELAVLYEEIGRAALPGPHFWSSFVAGHLVGSLGGDRAWHEALTTGTQTATVAIDELSSSCEPSSVRITALRSGAGTKLNGTKVFVPWASAADTILVLARTGDAPTDLTFFAVPTDRRGVEIEDVPMLSGERTGFVHLRDVTVDGPLGSVGSGWAAWRALLPAATVIQAAELTGIAEAALELGVQYAKDRIAFGKPIGTFQAIQHKCAEMAADRDGARFLTYEAICLLNEGQGDDPRVLLAKVFASGAAHRITKEAHQIYAAAGFVRLHALNFYYRRAKGLETTLGDSDDQLELAARALVR